MKKIISGIVLALLFIGCTNFVASPFPNFHQVYGANMGREIDLFSQKGGVGENVLSPPFDAGGIIILFAYVTYNQAPVQGMLVTFQVNNPQDTPILVSTAITNSSGYATISFRITPEMCPSPRSLWEAFATTSIAQKTVQDTMPFYVLCSSPIIVPEDYQTIQAAINGANVGDAILVKAGTYSSIVINKSVTLEGENKYTTVIEGGTEYHATESGVAVVADNVRIGNFTIQNETGPPIRICGDFGVRLANITISDNIMIGNGGAIRLINTTDDVIINNIIKEGVGGIGFYWANNTIVQNNTITLCQEAIECGDPSYNNTFLENNILNNSEAIQMNNVFCDNKFFHNNFVNNTQQVQSDGSPNTWDNGYPSGGNYWSDYKGADVHTGPYQNITGSDGIGDTPYVIDAYDTDYYPLASPFSTLSLSVTDLPVFIVLDLGQTQTFNSPASGGTLPYKYQWYINSIAVSGANDSSWTFAPSSASSYAICVKATDAASVTATSNIVAITVNSVLSVSVSPSSVALDVGQSETFTATASGGSGTYSSYQWYVDGQLQSGQTSTFVYSPTTRSQGTHSITVTVTDSLGATSPQSSPATVEVSATLIAPALTSSPGTVDQGQTSVLFNSTVISTGTPSYSYQWFEMTPGGSYAAVGSSLASFSFVTSGATATGGWSFILQVTDKVGVAVNSSAVSVMVNSALVALTVTSSPSTVDQGQTCILNSSPVTTGTSPYSYQWFEMASGASAYSVIGGATLTSYSFVTSVSTTTGVWHFELNVTDATGATATSNVVSVTVNLAPSVSISPSSVTLDVGQSQVFIATAAGGTGSLTYQWHLNDQIVGTGVTYNFSAQSAGSDSIYVTVTDSAGIPYMVTSNTASVTVNSAPTVSLTLSSWTLDVGQSETFTATASGGSGTYSSYQWYVDGQLQSGQTSTFVYSPTTRSQGTHSITVTVTDSLGATSPQSSPATVTVNAALAAPGTVAFPSTVDQGETSVLSNSSVISTGTGPYSYGWFEMAPSGSYALMGSGLSLSFVTSTATDTGSWSFILQVIDSTGAAVNSTAASVVVNAALAARTVTASASTVDQDRTSVLSNSMVISTGTSPYLYQWFEMASGASAYSVIGGATLTSYSFVTSVSTTTGVWHFELNVTDATGATATSNAVTVTVNAVPSVIVSPSSTTLDLSQSVLFNSTVTGGTSPYSRQWYLNGTAVPGATNSTWSFTPISTGSYQVSVKVDDAYGFQAESTSLDIIVALPNVAITSIFPSKPAIVKGSSTSVNVTIENEGYSAETFNVTLYGELLWGVENDTFPLYVFTGVTLTAGSTVTLTVSITLPAFPWGIYELKAIAGPVPDQTCASDLVCTGGYIRVFSPKIHVYWFYSRSGPLGVVPF